MTELITNSSMRDFHACQRLYQIRYVHGYRPLEERGDAAFGTLAHAGLEGWWRAFQENDDDPLAAALHRMRAVRAEAIDDVAACKADLLMTAYHLRWAGDMADLEVLGVEVPFRAKLRSPSGRPARGIEQAGKIDVLVRKRSDDSKWMVEHKTSGADLSPGSNYWARLRLEPQVSMYFEGARILGHELAGCIYDVLARPDHRPHQATPLDKRKYTQHGRLYANQRDRDESLEEFKVRVATAITDDPNLFLQRAEVVRLPEELESFKADVWATAALMRQARKGEAPRNPDHCFRYSYARPCAFHDVCCGAASLDDQTRFVQLSNVHPELPAE